MPIIRFDFVTIVVLAIGVVLGGLAGLFSRSRIPAERRKTLLEAYKAVIAEATDLEAFAQFAEFAATHSNSTAQFVLDLNYLTMNALNNWVAIIVGTWDRTLYVLHWRFRRIPLPEATSRFGSSGFAADDDSNQVQHFWYFVAVAYQWGETIADWLGWYHEWNGPGLLRHLPLSGQGHGTEADLILSRQGVVLGRLLATGAVGKDAVGDWIRRELGPPIDQSKAG